MLAYPNESQDQRQIRHANLSETQGYLHSLGLFENETAKQNFPTI
jgi:hypothetical protein